MKRSILFFLFIVCCSLVKAQPYDTEIDGVCYKINGNEAMVTVYSDNEEHNYWHYSGSIVIRDTIIYRGSKYPVTTIGPKTFKLCHDVTEITLPNTITTISSEAFRGNIGLKKMNLSANVKDIANNAFYGLMLWSLDIDPANKNFVLEDQILYTADHKRAITFVNVGWVYSKEVKFHDALETIDDGFATGRRFYSLNFNKALKRIGEYAFQYAFTEIDCDENLILPDGMEHIGQHAFDGCIRINNLHLPDNLTRLEPYSFDHVGPQYIHMPKNLKVICDYALFCVAGGSFTNLVLPEGLDSIGAYGITCIDCDTLVVPESVRYLSSNSLENTSKCIIIKAPLESIPENAIPSQRAQEIVLPRTVKRLEKGAFYPCYRLKKIIWPDALEYIGPAALAGNKINPMVIPSTVKQIGNDALADNVEEPRTYYFTSKTPPVCGNVYVFRGIYYEESTLYVPKGCKAAYSADAPWNWFGTILEYDENDPYVGISPLTISPATGKTFDMSGRQVDGNYKGIVVKNGKKYIEK